MCQLPHAMEITMSFLVCPPFEKEHVLSSARMEDNTTFTSASPERSRSVEGNYARIQMSASVAFGGKHRRRCQQFWGGAAAWRQGHQQQWHPQMRLLMPSRTSLAAACTQGVVFHLSSSCNPMCVGGASGSFLVATVATIEPVRQISCQL